MMRKRMWTKQGNSNSMTKQTNNNSSKPLTPTFNNNIQLIVIIKISQFLAVDLNSNLSLISSPNPTDPLCLPLAINLPNSTKPTLNLKPLNWIKISTNFNYSINFNHPKSKMSPPLAKTSMSSLTTSIPQIIKTKASKKWNNSFNAIICFNFGPVNWKKSWETHEFLSNSHSFWAFLKWMSQKFLISCVSLSFLLFSYFHPLQSAHYKYYEFRKEK